MSDIAIVAAKRSVIGRLSSALSALSAVELGTQATTATQKALASALGHPIGASGTRILLILLYNMQRLQAKKGLATLCVGGGQGVSLCVEQT